MKVLFKPEYNTSVEILRGVRPTWQIKNEPMLFHADPEFAWVAGGVLTREVLKAARLLNPLTGPWVIDTRVHMLMPGQLPAIGGWHCDWVPRTVELEDGPQPDMSRLHETQKNFVITFSDHPEGVSRTRYLDEEFEAEIDPTKKVWSQVHDQIERAGLRSTQIDDGVLVSFWRPALHMAMPAERAGWRWFFRASRLDTPPVNEIRKQAMVYLRDTGW